MGEKGPDLIFEQFRNFSLINYSSRFPTLSLIMAADKAVLIIDSQSVNGINKDRSNKLLIRVICLFETFLGHLFFLVTLLISSFRFEGGDKGVDPHKQLEKLAIVTVAEAMTLKFTRNF